MRLQLCSWCLFVASLSSAGWAQVTTELLADPGFESGSLAGWLEGAGAGEGQVVTAGLFANMPPGIPPRSGTYCFSSSTQDGATGNTPRIELLQNVDLDSFPSGSLQKATVEASCWVFRREDISFDTATLTLEFRTGGAAGSILSSTDVGPLIPVIGNWFEFSIPAQLIPASADTVTFRYVTDLDPGFFSIDLLMDDASLILRQFPAEVSNRTAGVNPISYVANPPVIGGSFQATVDLAGTTGHSLAVLFGYRNPLNLALGGGQVLLADPTSLGAELLGLPTAPGPIAAFSVPIPNDLALCGLALSTQAVHAGGVQPFALSNAQDLVLGVY